MTPALSIVVPVLNEAGSLRQRLEALRPFRERGARVVVVDGGSHDATPDIAHRHADLALTAPRGRASQMNAGALAAPADVVLFLHADTQLPAFADTLVARAIEQGSHWGRFDVRIDSSRRALAVVGRLMNLRSRVSGIATGDQAIFVRYETFRLLGGFPEIALMEDISLSKRLKAVGPPACLSQKVVTSARRWEKHGVARTVLLMWRLRLAYFLGADPDDLAVQYGYTPYRT